MRTWKIAKRPSPWSGRNGRADDGTLGRIRYFNAVPPLVERWLGLSEDEKIRIFESARSQVSQEAHKQSQDRLYVTQLLHAACPELENQDICKEFQGKGVIEIVERLLKGVEDDGYLESSAMLERRTKKFLKWIESRGALDSTETNKKMLIIFRNYFLCCFSVALLREFHPGFVRGNNE